MNTRSTAFLGSALVVTAFNVACSSSKTDQARGPVGNAGAPADARPVIGPYPGEPYGNAVGDTLTNLQLQGYLNEEADAISNTKPFVDSYSLEDVRATGASYALVHVSEFF
jgi:hypothetical protein